MNDEFFTDFDEVAMEERRGNDKRRGRKAVGESISLYPEEWARLTSIGEQVGIVNNRSAVVRHLVRTHRTANREEPAQ